MVIATAFGMQRFSVSIWGKRYTFLLMFAVDCVLMPLLLWDKFFGGIDLGTRPPFLLAIMFFLSALLLLASGLILELLSDALNAVTDRKPFIIRSKVGFDRS